MMGSYLVDNNQTKCSIISPNTPENDQEMFDVPSDPSNKILELTPKSPIEERFYSFSLRKRMRINDEIISVSFETNSQGNDSIEADMITCDGFTFKARLKKGTLYQDDTLYWTVKTKEGETLSFTCILPIRPEGLLAKTDTIRVIVGDKGRPGISVRSISIDRNGTFIFTMTDETVQKVYPNNIKPVTVPPDFILNGGLYLAPDGYVTGSKVMPAGLWLNGNVVVTDGTVIYQDTWNNGGLLCAAS